MVRLTPWNTPPFEVNDKMIFRKMVQWLFAQRNKKLGKALVPFIKSMLKISDEEAGKLVRALPFCELRARELAPEGFGELANALLH